MVFQYRRNMEWGTFSKAQSEQKISKLLSVVPDAMVSRTPRTFVTNEDKAIGVGREVVLVDVELYTYNEKGKKVLSSFQYNNLDNRK